MSPTIQGKISEGSSPVGSYTITAINTPERVDPNKSIEPSIGTPIGIFELLKWVKRQNENNPTQNGVKIGEYTLREQGGNLFINDRELVSGGAGQDIILYPDKVIQIVYDLRYSNDRTISINPHMRRSNELTRTKNIKFSINPIGQYANNETCIVYRDDGGKIVRKEFDTEAETILPLMKDGEEFGDILAILPDDTIIYTKKGSGDVGYSLYIGEEQIRDIPQFTQCKVSEIGEKLKVSFTQVNGKELYYTINTNSRLRIRGRNSYNAVAIARGAAQRVLERNGRLNEQIMGAQETISGLTDMNDRAREIIEKQSKQITALQERINQMEKERKKQERELNSSRETITILQDQNREVNRDLAAMTKMYDRLAESITDALTSFENRKTGMFNNGKAAADAFIKKVKELLPNRN